MDFMSDTFIIVLAVLMIGVVCLSVEAVVLLRGIFARLGRREVAHIVIVEGHHLLDLVAQTILRLDHQIHAATQTENAERQL